MNKSTHGLLSESYIFDHDAVTKNEIIGQMGKNIKGEDALALGRVLGNMYFFQGYRIACVAYDERMSSSLLEEELCRGLAWEGLFVLRLGHCTTAVAHFTMKMLEAHLAVIVTGGDYPISYNGFRIFDIDGPVHGQKLKNITNYSKIGFNHNPTIGGIVNVNATNIYQEHMISQDNSSNTDPIVWNCAGGSSSSILHDIVHQIPGNHLLINDDNLSYPSSNNPITEGIKITKEVILEENANFGFLFNSDTSSLLVINELGEPISAFETAIAILETFIKKHKTDENKKFSIVSDTLAPLWFLKKLEQSGITHYFSSSHFAPLMNDMSNYNAILSVNYKGYIGFGPPMHGCPDGLLAAITFLEFISIQNRDTPLSQIQDKIKADNPSIAIAPINVPTPMDANDAILSIENYLQQNLYDFCKHDALRIYNQHGWWRISPHSEDLHSITIHAEANNKDNLDQISNEIQKILNECSIPTS